MHELFIRFRQESAPAHDHLEKLLNLTRPDLSRRDYVALVERFAGFVAPWETRIATSLGPSWQAFLAPRMKTHLLADDLAALTGNPGALSGMTRCAVLPAVERVGQAVGSLYVMEGSTLGGKMLAPLFAERFGLRARRGYAYFDPYAGETGSMWRAFQAQATSVLAPAEYDGAVAAALDTFKCLADWFQPLVARMAA